MKKIKAYMNVNEFKENPVMKESIDKNIFNFRYSHPSDQYQQNIKFQIKFNKNEETSY